MDKNVADEAFDAAACIGCGAYVAAYPNGSPVLFVEVKVAQLASLPQGNPERRTRVSNMVQQMDKEGLATAEIFIIVKRNVLKEFQ